jgi:hypothetical protein
MSKRATICGSGDEGILEVMVGELGSPLIFRGRLQALFPVVFCLGCRRDVENRTLGRGDRPRVWRKGQNSISPG